MSERDYRLFLSDMLESIAKIERYTSGMDFKKFSATPMAIDAVIRNFEIIGEAARNVPDEIQMKYPAIPWSKVKAMRNIVIHEYFGVDLNIAWKTIKDSLPILKEKVLKAVEGESST